ncbi:MAG: YceH family protein [Bacteroidetes bacterium]|nr:YceH family protein [Bacteroidota bacterium]
MLIFTPVEERILGSLIEKEFTTPEYYPLTLNALKNACNQKSNREPVVEYSEEEIDNTLNFLFEKKMVFKVTGAEFRVPKYNENFTKYFNLTKQETAVMCMLMLRGPQTIGELRGRTNRIFNFEDLAQVENTLQKLINTDGEQKFVMKLPRQTGRDPRYVSILCGEPDIENYKHKEEVKEDRLDKMENEIQQIRDELSDLKAIFEKFKEQFE